MGPRQPAATCRRQMCTAKAQSKVSEFVVISTGGQHFFPIIEVHVVYMCG